MNYLAHIYLSDNDNDIKVGNFIADSVKGRKYEEYSDGIRKGILLHRKIDSFADNHEIHKKTRDRIRHLYGKHSGIVVDIFYDHFLAKNWSQFSDEKFSSFINDFYLSLLYNFWSLPAKVKYVFPFLILNNWLKQYSSINGIGQILTRMSIHTSLPDFSEQVISEFQEHYDDFEKDFFEFFPLLEEEVEKLNGNG